MVRKRLSKSTKKLRNLSGIKMFLVSLSKVVQQVLSPQNMENLNNWEKRSECSILRKNHIQILRNDGDPWEAVREQSLPKQSIHVGNCKGK
jgi:hypothetical protein